MDASSTQYASPYQDEYHPQDGSSSSSPYHHVLDSPGAVPGSPFEYPSSKPVGDFGYVLPDGYTDSSLWTSGCLPLAEHAPLASLEDSWHQPSQDVDVVVPDLDCAMSPALCAKDGMSELSYLDPRFSYPQPILDCDNMSLITNMSRRLSDASTHLSTDIIGLGDSQFDDACSSVGEHAHLIPRGLHSRGTSTCDVSPVVSPMLQNAARPFSGHGKASPSPRQSLRVSPYTVDDRTKRWSTGSFLPSNNTAAVNQRASGVFSPTMHLAEQHHQNPTVPSSSRMGLPQGAGFLPTSYLQSQPEPSQPMYYHPFFRMLHSNAESHHHYADLSDPPDLYGALSEEQLPPPPEDMDPEDPDMKPHEQELRFDGDLYTPRWVRNHGNKREGWCGICKPGRWLVLKNSAFWYDKSFTHGISAATGQAFTEPKDVRRMDGNPDVWEGLCHSCHEWVSLVSNKKKGTTWFRHAYKCHTHQKIKDAPKRRRESSQSKVIVNKV